MKLSDYINETNLSRVFQHLNEPNRCMIAISSLRDEINDTKERKFLTKQLQFDIKAGGFGFSKVTGAFIENKDTPFEKEVYEDSFLVFFKSSELEKAKNILELYVENIIKMRIYLWLMEKHILLTNTIKKIN